MSRDRCHRLIRIVRVLLLAAVAGQLSIGWRVAAAELPGRLTDQQFWALVSDMSEPDGFFRSDNFMSNEINFQRVIPALKQATTSGGVYMGVGPEQNFTYLVALRPKLAFIVDIRRQNMVEHLLYKAFIEQADNRADFLSLLFARRRPADLKNDAAVDTLLGTFIGAEPSEDLFTKNLAGARGWLMKRHGFALTTDDDRQLQYVYRTFFEAGPLLTYNFIIGSSSFRFGGGMPTYADLMTATDGTGEQRGYLATEENFRVLKQLETENRIIPLVGNFAGPKALRAVGQYLREHDATVTAFYLSNVEQYLFQQRDDWRKFLTNVATLPVDARSTFIRSVSAAWAPPPVSRGRARTMLCPIADVVRAFGEDRIQGYSDVIAMSR